MRVHIPLAVAVGVFAVAGILADACSAKCGRAYYAAATLDLTSVTVLEGDPDDVEGLFTETAGLQQEEEGAIAAVFPFSENFNVVFERSAP